MGAKSGTCSRFFLFLILLFAPVTLHAQSLSINDTTVGFEGASGSTIASFTVTRSSTGSGSSVQFNTSNGTATGGSSCSGNTDYITFTGGGLSFLASETSKTITITVCGDSRNEADETFFINLSSPSGATIGDGQGQAIITNDDPEPSLRINDISLNEGNAGQANAVFTVTLSTASGQNVSAVFATANDTATGAAACGGNTDFVNSNNTVNFTAGVTSQTIPIAVCGDTTNESNERLRVNLSNPGNATIQDGIGIATITNDDAAPPPLPTLSIGDVTVNESALSAVFTFTLSNPNPAGATVHFVSADVTATGSGKTCSVGADYVVRGGNRSFGPTETTKTLSVPLCGDTVDEPNETFRIQLSSPTGMTLPDPVAVGTILDND